MSNENPYALLSDHSLVKHLEKKKQTRKQTLFRTSEKDQQKVNKKQPKKTAIFGIIYDVEYMWFTVLEYLPLRDLLACSLVDKYTCGMVHSFNCYSEILKRDYFSKYEQDCREFGKVVKNTDNTGLFGYLLQNYIGKTKITSEKRDSLKQASTEIPDAKYKKMFGRIFKGIERIVEERKLEREINEQHLRNFLIEKIGKKSLVNMRAAVKECSHNHCEIVSIDMQPYTYRIKCLNCKVAVLTNFTPEDVFRRFVGSRICGVERVIKQPANFEKYPLRKYEDSDDVLEFDHSSLYLN